MRKIPAAKRALNRLTGYLYAALFFASDTLVLGASLLGWFTLLPIIFGVFLWMRTFSAGWLVAAGVFILLLRLGYSWGKRNGFIVFAVEDGDSPSPEVDAVSVNQKYDLLASGIFSVTGREEYMFRRPALIWRVPFGDHALMVERPQSKYLYQFIEAGHIQSIQPGALIYGNRVNPALEIHFKTTWGPDAGETEFNWFSPKESAEPKRLKRTLYLGFKNDNDREEIWWSLLVSNGTE